MRLPSEEGSTTDGPSGSVRWPKWNSSTQGMVETIEEAGDVASPVVVDGGGERLLLSHSGGALASSMSKIRALFDSRLRRIVGEKRAVRYHRQVWIEIPPMRTPANLGRPCRRRRGTTRSVVLRLALGNGRRAE